MEKDAARIEGIQARNQVRLQRFLNARQRTIGLDVQALNDQIEEKRRLKELQKDTERLEGGLHKAGKAICSLLSRTLILTLLMSCSCEGG